MRWFWNLGKKASISNGSRADREKLSFVLPLEVGFTGLKAAHSGRQQHWAETEQKLEKYIIILTPTLSEIIYLGSKSGQTLVQRADCAHL